MFKPGKIGQSRALPKVRWYRDLQNETGLRMLQKLSVLTR